MKHSEAERGNLVERYIGESLSADERADFEDHLIACEACQAEVAWVQDLKSGLADVVDGQEESAGSSTAGDSGGATSAASGDRESEPV